MQEQFAAVNGIRLAYLDHPSQSGAGETLILLHGLTANAHSFDGLIDAGLNRSRRVVAADLRGRGRTDKPGTGYAQEDHAQDILQLMDALGIARAVLGGHSFGGRLALYMAAYHPARITKLILIDTGFFHPRVAELVMPSIERLGRIVPSMDEYIDGVRNSAYYRDGFWDGALEAYYRADVEVLDDGSVRPRSQLAHIVAAAQAAEALDWEAIMKRVEQPALLLHAPEGFGPPGTPPVLTEEGARRAAQVLRHGEYRRVAGHHITMVFGEHAAGVVRAIDEFLRGP